MIEVVLVERAMELVKVRLTNEGSARRQRCLENGACTVCEQAIEPDEEGVTRGAHAACYQACRRLVAAGKATWQELVRNGEILPPSNGGRPASNPLVKKYSRR